MVASDVSYRFTLHTGSLSLRLPLRPAELLEISRDYLPIDLLILSPDGLDPRKGKGIFGSYAAYAAFVETPELLRVFEPAEPLPDGSLVFRRRPSALPGSPQQP